MYNLLKKYKITERTITEDNDYLLKEEYDVLKKYRARYDGVKEFMEIYNNYNKELFEKYNKDDYFIFPRKIEIIKPSEYSASRNNYITFYSTALERANEGRIYCSGQYLSHKEEGFKSSFISNTYKLLLSLCSNNNIEIPLMNLTEYSYSNEATFTLSNELMDICKNNLILIKELDSLLKYYEDKVVAIKEDERLLKELEDIDDFLSKL